MNKVIEKPKLESSISPNSQRKNKCRSFFFRYMELCRSRNIPPLADIKPKNDKPNYLEIFGDKISVKDWLLIVEALYNDQVLRSVAIKTRKSGGFVWNEFDTERKAKLFKQKPALYTKFVFSGIVEALCNCISFNKNLRVLHLEGLPLTDIYVDAIAKAVATNDQLREISFARSNIQDEGCDTICNTVKYLENIERINLSECGLTTKGAQSVAEMIKMQKISRYTEGWQQSLRYRDVDPNSIPGLREIVLSKNPAIEDNGVKAICEVLKEDVWIKVVEMEDCGLTDLGANCIIDCLAINNIITDFNANNNNGVSKFLLRTIHEQLGKEDAEQRALEEHQQYVNGVTSANLGKMKVSMAQLKDRLKFLEDRLEFERVLRTKAEQLNERLNQQIIVYENQIEQVVNSNIPEGFVVVKNEALQAIIKERNELLEMANAQMQPECSKHVNTQRSECRSMDSAEDQQAISAMPLATIYESAQDDITEDDESSQKKTPRVRKVKSETVQIELLPSKFAQHKPEARSDNEFISDAELQMGSLTYVSYAGTSSVNKTIEIQRNSKTYRSERKPKKINSPTSVNCIIEEEDVYDLEMASRFVKETEELYNFADSMQMNSAAGNKGYAYEIDELQLESSRTEVGNEEPAVSDTVRNSAAMKLSTKLYINTKTDKHKAQPEQKLQHEIGQGDGDKVNVDINAKNGLNKSPRSLFFGAFDD